MFDNLNLELPYDFILFFLKKQYLKIFLLNMNRIILKNKFFKGI